MVRQYQGSVAKIISTSRSWGTKRGPLGAAEGVVLFSAVSTSVLDSSTVELV